MGRSPRWPGAGADQLRDFQPLPAPLRSSLDRLSGPGGRARGADRGELSWQNTSIFRHGCLGPALAKGRPKKSRHSCLWEIGTSRGNCLALALPAGLACRYSFRIVAKQNRVQPDGWPWQDGGQTRQRPLRCCRLGMPGGDRHQIGPFARPSLHPFRIKDQREPSS
jgi:hypothetical protein